MTPLHVSDLEREGRYGRIEATELLRFPAWAPFLQGLEPYGDLLDLLHEAVADRTAVLEFPYDWRLPVAFNGRLLAEAAHAHLTRWRASDSHQRARRLHPDGRPARLVFVAHSMGGLVTSCALAHAPELDKNTRAVITLGTPFLGAVKAAAILNGNRSATLPAVLRRRMQALSATLPGVHDLLPRYRCVDVGLEVRRLTPCDVAALGGDKELAEQSLQPPEPPRLPGHRQVVGVAQPTMQSLRLESGLIQPQYVAFQANGDGELARDRDGVPMRHDRAGDGTVYRESASFGGGSRSIALPLQHGALAKDSVVLAYVRAVLTEQDEHLGPALGGGEIGLDVPDSVEAGAVFTVRLTGPDTPAGLGCTVHEAGTGRRVATPRVRWQDGEIVAQLTLPEPGLYRVRIEAGGNAPITQLVMVLEPDTDTSGSGPASDACNV